MAASFINLVDFKNSSKPFGDMMMCNPLQGCNDGNGTGEISTGGRNGAGMKKLLFHAKRAAKIAAGFCTTSVSVDLVCMIELKGCCVIAQLPSSMVYDLMTFTRALCGI